jgi:hypothetical protein
MATTKKTGFQPTLVHAYRRQPHLNADGKEIDVPVVFDGEKVLFKSNAAGHIVGLVQNEATFKRLVKEIPEAYIEYAGGENIPEKKPETGPAAPLGEYVLTNGTESKVLDDMTDVQLRDFAAQVGIEQEALPAVLTGDTLKKAIFNTLNTGA